MKTKRVLAVVELSGPEDWVNKTLALTTVFTLSDVEKLTLYNAQTSEKIIEEALEQ